MRILLAAALLLAASGALAQSQARPRPPGTVPLEEPPPPPAVIEGSPAPEPQVRVRKDAAGSVHEYRLKGRLYMMRVVPAVGRPYVLVDHRGDGTFSRQENTLDPGLRVPQWVLAEF